MDHLNIGSALAAAAVTHDARIIAVDCAFFHDQLRLAVGSTAVAAEINTLFGSGKVASQKAYFRIRTDGIFVIPHIHGALDVRGGNIAHRQFAAAGIYGYTAFIGSLQAAVCNRERAAGIQLYAGVFLRICTRSQCQRIAVQVDHDLLCIAELYRFRQSHIAAELHDRLAACLGICQRFLQAGCRADRQDLNIAVLRGECDRRLILRLLRRLAEFGIILGIFVDFVQRAKICPHAVTVFVYIHFVVAVLRIFRIDLPVISVVFGQLQQKCLGRHAVNGNKISVAVKTDLEYIIVILDGTQILNDVKTAVFRHGAEHIIAEHIEHPVPFELHIVIYRIAERQRTAAEQRIGVIRRIAQIDPLHSFFVANRLRIHIKVDALLHLGNHIGFVNVYADRSNTAALIFGGKGDRTLVTGRCLDHTVVQQRDRALKAPSLRLKHQTTRLHNVCIPSRGNRKHDHYSEENHQSCQKGLCIYISSSPFHRRRTALRRAIAFFGFQHNSSAPLKVHHEFVCTSLRILPQS